MKTCVQMMNQINQIILRKFELRKFELRKFELGGSDRATESSGNFEQRTHQAKHGLGSFVTMATQRAQTPTHIEKMPFETELCVH